MIGLLDMAFMGAIYRPLRVCKASGALSQLDVKSERAWLMMTIMRTRSMNKRLREGVICLLT